MKTKTYIHFEKKIFIPESPAKVFERTVMDVSFLEQSVKAFGPLPGVLKAEIVGGTRLCNGVTRKVTLTSGGILNERVDLLENGPHSFRLVYQQTSGFPFPLSLISKDAGGEYEALPQDSGTILIWRSRHELQSVFVYPVAFVMRWLFVHPMMSDFLEHARNSFHSE